jgi:hypothetical protein
MVRDADFLRNEDLWECGHDDRPEDGYRRADDGEVYLDACDSERCRVPPGKVLKMRDRVSI